MSLVRLIRICESLKRKREVMLSGAITESDEVAAKALGAVIDVLEDEITEMCK